MRMATLPLICRCCLNQYSFPLLASLLIFTHSSPRAKFIHLIKQERGELSITYLWDVYPQVPYLQDGDFKLITILEIRNLSYRSQMIYLKLAISSYQLRALLLEITHFVPFLDLNFQSGKKVHLLFLMTPP